MAVTRAKRRKVDADEKPKQGLAPPTKKAHKRKDDDKKLHPPKALVKALLRNKAYALAYPPINKGHGEVDWDAKDRQKPLPEAKAGETKVTSKQRNSGPLDISTGKPRGYSSPDLSPYEELLCAVMLSKPLSHKLGLRAIATLLSPPYAFTTVDALSNASEEGRRSALYEARTQHKDKTATQLGDLAEGLKSVCGDKADEQNALKAVRKAVEESKSQQDAVDTVHRHLVDNIKGLGPTGAAIFLRRIQSHEGWQNVFPYIDERTAETACKLGLLLNETGDTTSISQQLADMIDGSEDKRRRDFVRLLDVLVGLGFHKDLGAVKQEITS